MEVLVALAIVAIIMGFSTTMISSALRGTQDNINKQFATQKAVSMLEELRALVQTDKGDTAVVLDDYDDGTTNQTLLTTRRGVKDPADAASGNTKVGDQWLFERRVTVQRLQGANDVRLVNVKVFVRDVGGLRVLAEVAGVLSTIGQNMPPTQVYDVYLIAVENVPGWWLYMQNIVPFVEGAIADLETRHPGLEFRTHWVRKLSYGRDPQYMPHVNRQTPSTSQIDWVYFYPGALPAGLAVENYYPPDFFKGRVSIDGTPVNGADPEKNPYPYALADQYNNAMRHRDEANLFAARGEETPTLRLLLDDMVLKPHEYRNAIIINLHGELFPFPPVRNYSDAAKLPGTMPNVRVVTHPERLHYDNAAGVNLRVYSYHTNVAQPEAVAPWLSQPISITLENVVWNPVPGDIQAMPGGVDFDGDGNLDNNRYDGWKSAPANPQPVASPTGGMWWWAANDGTDTVILLYNSPLKSPCVSVPKDKANCEGGGLPTNAQLYALEYIPSPVENLAVGNAPFSRTLGTKGAGPKNTARWQIRIPSFVLNKNREYAIETRIGAVAPKKDPAEEYPNLSRTYFWRGTDAWLFGDAVNKPNLPPTERFQFLGDPRHSPYEDVKRPHGASLLVTADPLGMGYNRYFDDFHSPAENARATWPGWSYQDGGGTWFGLKNNNNDADDDNDGWRTGDRNENGKQVPVTLEIDVPRIYQVLRMGVLQTNAVYTTMTGFSYFYVGIGNEIGYDSANGFGTSIPLSARPFNGSGAVLNEQSITDEKVNTNSGPIGGVKYIREDGTDWWAMTWLGELYPDSSWDTWKKTGNLPTGMGKGSFRRVLRSSINVRLPAGTALTDAVRRPQEEGSTTFFWSGSANATFHHRYQDGTSGSLATDGKAVASTYNLPMPDDISNNRPFDVAENTAWMNPDHFLQNAYGPPTTLTPLSQFYRHSTNIHGSSLLAMRDGNQAAFVVVNGLSPVGQSGVAFIARWSFLSLIQSFLASGRYSTLGQLDPARVRELPRVVITSPNDNVDIVDPVTLKVTWETSWRRWDGLPYTPAYPNGFAEDTPVRYKVMYSRDNGRSWLYAQDDQPATAGAWPEDDKYLQGGTSFVLSTPKSTFPKGNYLLRIEAYRDKNGERMLRHYAFHQYRAFIKRS